MRNQHILGASWAFALLMLGACGGGGGDTVGPLAKEENLNPSNPITSAVTITSESAKVMYHALNTFVVSGDNVGRLDITAQGACSQLEPISSSGNQKRVACRPGQVGTNVLTLIATDPFTKKEVGVQSFSVPKPEVTLTTTLGSLVVILEPEKAPLSSQNFLDVVASGYYKGTVFHDLMLGNRLLGGLYALNGEIWSPKTSSEVSTVEFESPLATGLSNTDGTIAVYRLPNSSLNSGSTGFLINLGDHGRIGNRRDGTSPDHSAYAVFGRLNEKSRELITKAIDTRSIVPKPPMNPTTSFPFEPPSPAVWISNATQTN